MLAVQSHILLHLCALAAERCSCNECIFIMYTGVWKGDIAIHIGNSFVRLMAGEPIMRGCRCLWQEPFYWTD